MLIAIHRWWQSIGKIVCQETDYRDKRAITHRYFLAFQSCATVCATVFHGSPPDGRPCLLNRRRIYNIMPILNRLRTLQDEVLN